MTIPEIVLLAGAITTGLVQWIKEIPFIPSWLYPLFSIIFGILMVMCIVAIGTTHIVFNATVVVYGVIAGLTAVGLYSGVSSSGSGVASLFNTTTTTQ